MKKFSKFVVNHTKFILIVFIAAAVISVFLSGLVGVNYEMSDYLPDESPSTVALDVMEEEFDGAVPNMRVMVKDVSIPEALEYKESLENIEGVTAVTWLDDAAEVDVPLEMLDQDVVETYYKDGAALFTVTADKARQVEITSEIRDLIGEDNAVTGSAVSSADATVGTVKDIQRIAIIAVIFVFIVLILTTDSWLVPIVILVDLGIAILINSGTNIIFGEISFVTNAAGAILQLAVSLDYAVFLIHRYEEYFHQSFDPGDAMQKAMCNSVGSILSSGLTTVIGFLALIFMRFRIGPDLGLALAKGVALSLITVFIFLPALVMTLHKWLDKLKHRSFMPDFHGFGRVVCRAMFPAVIIFVITIIPSYLASGQNTFYYGSAYIYGQETRYGRDTKAIDDTFGERETYVLMVPRGDLSTEQELSDALHNIPEIKSILSYVDTVGAEIPESYLDESILEQLESEHYSRYVLTVDTSPEGEDTFKLVETIRDTAQDYYPDTWYLAGESVSSYDLMDTITADMVKVNLIAIGAVFLVLLVTQRRLSLPIILVLSIETAIWINLAIPYFAGKPIFYISYLIISSIQLGATVDYAILMTDRYLEMREKYDRKQAIVETIASVMVSVMTSASVLAVAGALLGRFCSHGLLAQLGVFLGRGAVLSICIVLFVLPGLLYLTDKKERVRRRAERKQKTYHIGQEAVADEK